MNTKLAALLLGGAVLGGAGVANAEPVMLTETQMNDITAGHLWPVPYTNESHYGKWWGTKKIFLVGEIPWIYEGWHIDKGFIR